MENNALLGLIPLAVSLPIFWGAFRLLKKKRTIENIPTSKCAGVAMGLTELQGRCNTAGGLLRSPLRHERCVYFEYSVQEYREYLVTVTDSKGNTHTETRSEWVTLESGTEAIPFFVEDETGRVRVQPERARIEAPSRLSLELEAGNPMYDASYQRDPGEGNRRQFTESTLEPGDELYLIGTAKLDEEFGDPLLAFDSQDKFFVISCRSEKKVRRGYTVGGTVVLLLALALQGFGVAALCFGARMDDFWSIFLCVATPVFSLLLLWGIFLFNDLVRMRQLLRKAQANLDVDFKKRVDLVPKLVAVVQGFAGHEKTILDQIVDARAKMASQAQILAEKYPDLKADALFQDLMKRLSAVENRIALLRGFHNETAANYNSRVESFPELLLARLFGFTPSSLLDFPAVEKVPVKV